MVARRIGHVSEKGNTAEFQLGLSMLRSLLVLDRFLVPLIPSTASKRVFYATNRAHEETASARPPFNPGYSFRLTQPPNPSWKLGQGFSKEEINTAWKEEEEIGWRTWNLDETSSK